MGGSVMGGSTVINLLEYQDNKRNWPRDCIVT